MLLLVASQVALIPRSSVVIDWHGWVLMKVSRARIEGIDRKALVARMNVIMNSVTRSLAPSRMCIMGVGAHGNG